MSLKNLFRTGRHARKRAAKEMKEEANLMKMQRAEEERKREQEKKRAGKIRMRALRSRRSSSFFEQGGRETIG